MVGSQQNHETVTTTFELLAHHRRRHALQCLREHDTPMALADLADEVAVREYDAALPDIDAEDVTRVYLSLYHTHVPKLADADCVRYSQAQDSVTLRASSAAFEGLRPYLESNPQFVT
ncbi:DUF7344 domain-containing protein [Halopiger goleimassiliensis]|uniref:DUF7344 domain-containing protein n=1 Tax=Halopiger goleimassiliensis TaxID=1293048 RepID=UPI000677696C|nr:hypothetical protein [Halopiger goleimassiliensis]